MDERFLGQAQSAAVRGEDREAGRAQFWEDMIALGDGVVFGGFHFRVGPEDSMMKGYGGRPHRLIALDGTVTDTTNLWCQGRIPDAYRERLPDTLRAIQVYFLYDWFDMSNIDT